MNELTEEIISYIDAIGSNNISNNNISSNEWRYLSERYNLSEEFIRKYQNKVDWIEISNCQKLSESFIIEFQDKVNWNLICLKQVLSAEFLIEYQNKINFYHLLRNKELGNYNKKIQRFILGKVLKYAKGTISDHYSCFTEYMKEEYERLSIML
jgi:hypothetical protein